MASLLQMEPQIQKKIFWGEWKNIWYIWARGWFKIAQELMKYIHDNRESDKNRLKSQEQGQRGEIPY